MFFSLLFTVRAGLLLCFRFCQGSVNVPSYFAQGRMTLRYAMSQGRVLSCANGCVTSIQFTIYDKQSVVRYVNFSFFSILRAFLGSVIFFPRFFCFFLAICGIWIHVGFLMRDGLPPIWVVYVERLGVYEAFVCTRGCFRYPLEAGVDPWGGHPFMGKQEFVSIHCAAYCVMQTSSTSA